MPTVGIVQCLMIMFSHGFHNFVVDSGDSRSAPVAAASSANPVNLRLLAARPLVEPMRT